MTLHIPFDNSYAALPPDFFARVSPVPVKAPSLIAFNADLAREIGIDGWDEADLAPVFGGNRVPDGASPLAQLYAGHQFGQYNPRLGDGRAVLLGETVGPDGIRRDIQLKGSGRTPFSRMGDGRAWLGPVLREYVVSEAMHALGVPTTRALAAVRTGEPVYRERPLPGAVLTRVAQSHLRVGTFQAIAATGDHDALQTLFDYAVARHYPDAADPALFLDAVMRRQAALVAQWLSLGFIHGVMNTDNCAISGETIDYGPCAFMDSYHPATVYSSIDRFGRYSYAAQADIIVWNMAQLASALLGLMPDPEAAVEPFTAQIHTMPEMIRSEWLKRFAAKIGISDPRAEDAQLITDLLALMEASETDFTNTFRGLIDGSARGLFADPTGFDQWSELWQKRLETEPDAASMMAQANPVLIPRNHRIEEMIAAAVEGDDTLFHRLNAAYAAPFEANEADADLRQPPRPEEVVTATFCGT
ncbi:protein adenylyltransferase SelO [Marivita sp. GX14005]|uniref:protein adenylyltransferase SelO n=1 Tax=Marivita sp. GX14005 TaxID=2942276 RepID=UPI0020198EE4|nr:YdiU family protein [Marivita sp. GX14005]MCL3883432.1 YdiU family protein [Marivita sp. GX14005]